MNTNITFQETTLKNLTSLASTSVFGALLLSFISAFLCSLHQALQLTGRLRALPDRNKQATVSLTCYAERMNTVRRA